MQRIDDIGGHPDNITCSNLNCEQCKWVNRIKIKVEGLSPDMPTVTNEKGGKQSDTPYRLDLVPQLALLAEAKVLKRGAEKYGEENWVNIDIRSHLNHALQHIIAYLAGDRSDNHLVNLACRAHFALELQERGLPNKNHEASKGIEKTIEEF